MAIQKKNVIDVEVGSYVRDEDVPKKGKVVMKLIDREFKEMKLHTNDNNSTTMFFPLEIVDDMADGKANGFDEYTYTIWVGKDGEYGEYSYGQLEKWFEKVLNSAGEGVIEKFVEKFGDEPDFFDENVLEFMRDYCTGVYFTAQIEGEIKQGKEMVDKETGEVKKDEKGNPKHFRTCQLNKLLRIVPHGKLEDGEKTENRAAVKQDEKTESF